MQKGGGIHMGNLEQGNCNEQVVSKGEHLNQPKLCKDLRVNACFASVGLCKGNYVMHSAWSQANMTNNSNAMETLHLCCQSPKTCLSD
jgi:hypothetical protein